MGASIGEKINGERHDCPVMGCEATMQAGKVMCQRHWRLLGYRHRFAIFSAYKDPKRLAEWGKAVRIAIAWIEEHERIQANKKRKKK